MLVNAYPQQDPGDPSLSRPPVPSSTGPPSRQPSLSSAPHFSSPRRTPHSSPSARSTPGPSPVVLQTAFPGSSTPEQLQSPVIPPPGKTQLPNGKTHSPDPKTPAEYALHILFTQFVKVAEKKLNFIQTLPSDSEPNITSILGLGVDPTFDKILVSLGYIARHKPKPVIDSIMFWRKSKSETSVVTEPRRPEMHHPRTKSYGSNLSNSSREATILAERRSLVSIYILCRALIEVVKQTPSGALGEELGDKLEEIVFNQLKNADPETIGQSPIRLANWELFAEMLGCMSESRFAEVNDRFIEELEKHSKGPLPKDREAGVELVIQGMRYLKIKIYPMDALEECSGFLSSLAGFLKQASSFRIKRAYADLLNMLILPVVGAATAEVNHPTWSDTIKSLYPKIVKMALKQRNWPFAYPLAVTLLCVSPQEFFADHWFELAESNFSRFKDKTCKGLAVCCLSQLVWIYMFRYTDSISNTTRKLDIITKTLFPSGRKGIVPSDVSITPFIQLLRFICVKHFDYGYKNIICSLMNADQLALVQGYIPLDSLSPERMTVGIYGFLAILSSLASSETTPPFPTNFEDNPRVQNCHTLPSSLFSTPLIKDCYEHFCQTLGKIAFACDQYLFGGGNATDSPKTPIVGTFQFEPYGVSLPLGSHIRDKQASFDLLHAIFDAIPTCFPKNIPLAKVIDILCSGIGHIDPGVAAAARTALKAIAKTKNAKMIVTGYERYLFKYDERQVRDRSGDSQLAVSDDMLKLYIDLLTAWLEALQAKIKPMPETPMSPISNDENLNRSEELETTSIWSVIEETEANGLFFLCSQSRKVRRRAISVMRLITEFETVLDYRCDSARSITSPLSLPSTPNQSPCTRIIHILENNSSTVLDFDHDLLSTAERTRLHKLQQNNKTADTLLHLAESDNAIDMALWYRAFPRLIKICFEKFPMAVVLCRNTICERLLHMQTYITALVEGNKLPNLSPFDILPKSIKATTYPEMLIEQWKLYLIMACSTLTLTDEQAPKLRYRHGRKRSVPVAAYERITSARAVFQLVIPLLAVEHNRIRQGVVTALGCINVNLYKVLVEDLQPIIRSLGEDVRVKQYGKQSPSPRRNRRQDRLRAEVTHIFQSTSHFLLHEEISRDDWILETLVNFIKDTKVFLSDADVQVEWEYQELRRHFCGLMEALYNVIIKTPEPSRWLPFEGRVSCFRLIEEWCGFGQYASLAKQREEKMKASVLAQYKDVRDRGALTAPLEIEKRNVELAALSVLASLCSGPVMQPIEQDGSRKALMAFDIGGLLRWIDAVFTSPSERIHKIGRRALSNLLTHNVDHGILFEDVVQQCYVGEPKAKVTQSFFMVAADTLTEYPDTRCQLFQILALCILKAGDKNIEVRLKAVHLLETTEMRHFGRSVLEEFEIGLASDTPAVYRRHQSLLSQRIAETHPDQVLYVFSEYTSYIYLVNEHYQQDIISALLPWIRMIELHLDPTGEDLSSAAQMVFANMFEIQVRLGDHMLDHIEALWTALASGPFPGNVKAILDYILKQSIHRRDPAFVNLCREVIVYLSRTPAGVKLVEALIAYLQPRSMIPQVVEPSPTLNLDQIYPHHANLSTLLTPPIKPAVFSYGQLALIFLADIVQKPLSTMTQHVPLILHIVFSQLDHYTCLIHDQTKEMLIHLLHEIPERRRSDTFLTTAAKDLISDLRKWDNKLFWSYDDLNNRKNARTPKQMEKMVHNVIEAFSVEIPDLRHTWGKTALTWATSCPVRHLACRSFQVFRCLMPGMTQDMLADMLARLSNTIADTSNDIQGFAMEILATLDAVTSELDVADALDYPQLFWATVACLNTIHEPEFLASLSILEKLIVKIDLSNPSNVAFLMATFPPKWEGKFEGLQSLILKGLRSSRALEPSFKILERLNEIPDNELVYCDGRLLYGVLANLPRFLDCIENSQITDDVVIAAQQLSSTAERQELYTLAKILDSYGKSRFRTKEDFLRQIVHTIRELYFPQHETQALIFLLGLLSNKLTWMRLKTLELLKAVLPHIDMRKPDFVGVGADLIAPLLRLLQTDHAHKALKVLDEAISISGGPMDRHILRMSLGNSTIRKEYERTATLFGIPDETGWAIPIPAVTATTTRNNVHAVFYTCVSTTSAGSPGSDVQFHADDYIYSPIRDDRTATMLSDDRTEVHMGDMVSTLHNLDQWFAEDVPSHAPTPSLAGTEYSVEHSESAPHVYDTRVAAIVSRSLMRTPSTTSFKTNLADSFGAAYGNVRPSMPHPHAYRSSPNTDSPGSPASLDSRGIKEEDSFESGDDYDNDEDTVVFNSNSFENSFGLEKLIRTAKRSSSKMQLSAKLNGKKSAVPRETRDRNSRGRSLSNGFGIAS
ncbi:Cell morphogenesis protein PAG1 [Neolecta irregularis DAH-3]|uniref:Cell morphogenesis protein PAG1 n=1 Tax=Neolecta irregularis (strain DAH-3) TaxID=1198029 RepID=A0A1U7LKI3_NEOID|nr:Cell morphogenesis protein PAG1 [Neolecta irregularis DAH-3]|eukprot:OLL23052.1 Cell morphogenesis protein PAG1 [Neolecta irregularis DAH-3]